MPPPDWGCDIVSEFLCVLKFENSKIFFYSYFSQEDCDEGVLAADLIRLFPTPEFNSIFLI